MPKAYWIVRVAVSNRKLYLEYLIAAKFAFDNYGARLL